MRFAVYCGASAIVCTLMLGEALLVYPNLFSALVGLSDSVVKVCALINLACCLTILWTKMVLYVFLGGARANEMQTVYNKGWMFLCNSIIYWSVRNLRSHITAYDLGVCMLSIFVLIALHWVCNERVKVAFFETDPPSYFNLARLGALCFILGGIDITLCYRAITDFLKRKYSLSLFGMFLLDLLEMSIIFIGHYVINFCEMIYLMRNEDEDEWDRKMLLQTLVNITSCVLGIVAHCAILYVFNLNTSDTLTFGVRVVNLYQDVRNLNRQLTSKSEVDKFSKPAEPADLERDNICVICRDEMSAEFKGHPKKGAQRLQCGHVMHSSCLKSWMARSDKCPTCRQSVHTAASAFAVVEQSIDTPGAQVNIQGIAGRPFEEAGAQQAGDAASDRASTPAAERPLNDLSSIAPISEDEDVSDLFHTPQNSPRQEAVSFIPVLGNVDLTNAGTSVALQQEEGAQSAGLSERSPASQFRTFTVERETPFSGRIVSSGNISHAYTFRENYLF